MSRPGRQQGEWHDAVAIIDPHVGADGLHQWPFDPAFPVDVRHLAYAAGEREIRMNRHPYFEVNCVVAGELEFQVGARRFLAGAGDAVVLSGVHYHTAHATRGPRARRTRAVALFFMPDVIRQDPRGEEYLVPYLMQDERFPFVVPAASPAAPEVLRLVEAIGAELAAATRVARLAVEAQLKMLLVELVRHYASAPGALESYHQREKALARLRPLFAHLDARPADRVSLARAARMVGMSEPRFTRFFKQITGQSFHAYVTRLGIARAQQLLRQGASASEVSQAVGFASASHFGVVFRRLTGMTPLEFRRRSVRDSL